MAHKQGNGDMQSYTSLLSSSFFHEDISIKNDLSLVFNHEDDILDIAFQSFGEARVEDLNHRESVGGKGSSLELRRATSFEDMLMENHRTVLIDSIRQYFIKIQHEFLNTICSNTIFKEINKQDSSLLTIKQASGLVEVILSQNSQISPAAHSRIMSRLVQNPDEMSFVAEMLKICPKKIEFEVLFLICYILQQSNDIIQHFRRKNLTKELKSRSLKLASELKDIPCLCYLFESSKSKEVSVFFELLIEKWMITLFLMKIGVFQNELDTKSIDDCLKSEIFSKIDLNDLLNQHLIRPGKKLTKLS